MYDFYIVTICILENGLGNALSRRTFRKIHINDNEIDLSQKFHLLRVLKGIKHLGTKKISTSAKRLTFLALKVFNEKIQLVAKRTLSSFYIYT